LKGTGNCTLQRGGLTPFQTASQCVGQELNLHSVYAGGLQPLRLANAQPTQFSVARVGIEPTDVHQGLSLAALPVCVPCQQASPMGFEPMISTVTGWRALQAAPRGRNSVPGAGVEPTSAGSEPDVLPVRRPRSHYLLEPTSLLKVRGEGVEPSSPGSKPGSLPLADPRDEAEGERVELSRLIARPFSRRLPSPVGLPFRSKLRRQESNLQSSP
jgi:hypothetical protein